jgi:hypothetical protein
LGGSEFSLQATESSDLVLAYAIDDPSRFEPKRFARFKFVQRLTARRQQAAEVCYVVAPCCVLHSQSEE